MRDNKKAALLAAAAIAQIRQAVVLVFPLFSLSHTHTRYPPFLCLLLPIIITTNNKNNNYYSRWYGPGRIGREFRPRHAMLTMHIWFLHKRLIADIVDKQTALMIQEELFNILWLDTTCRIRQQGVNELLVNKNLLQVQQYTFMHLTHYDHCYTEFLNKPAQRLKELRKIVWQHILVRDEESEFRTDQLNRMAWYIEANYQNIMLDWPDEYYRESRVAWIDLPNFANMKDVDGTVMSDQPCHPEDLLPNPWQRNITNRGIEYYWNPDTRQSSWERPI